MFVVAHFEVPDTATERFGGQARAALAAFAARPGYRHGQLARAIEDPQAWVLTLEWENLGSYRRALSAYDVKMATGPMMGLASNQPSAFEVVVEAGLGESTTGPR